MAQNRFEYIKQEPELQLNDAENDPNSSDFIGAAYLRDAFGMTGENTDFYADEEEDETNSTEPNSVIKEEPEEEIIDIDGSEVEFTLAGDDHSLFICAICSFLCVEESVLLRHTKEKHLIDSKVPHNDMESSSMSPSELNSETTAEKYYECDICGKRMKQMRSFRNHMSRHSDDQPYHCKYCPKQYTVSSQAIEHELTHTGFKFACDECPMQFAYGSSLKRHKRSHTLNGKKLYECVVCSKRLASRDNLKHHMLIHSKDKPHNCHQCSESFTRKRSLVDHMKKKHFQQNALDDETFACDECPKEFSSVRSLNSHKQNHARAKCFRCAICSMDFSIRYQFIQHMNTHNDILFQCSHCSKRFQNRPDLRTHEKTHDKRHMKSKSEEPDTFSCKQCSKTFKVRSSLKRHEQIHLNGSHVKCHFCSKTFQRSYINEHMKMHTGGKIFKCIHCSKAFRKRSKLELHKQTHLNEAVLKIQPEVISLIDECD